MNPRRVIAVARKEALHVLRDPRSLGMAVAIPVLLIVLFGYALTLDVDNVPALVLDHSGSPASREVISRFVGSRYFQVRGAAADLHAIEQAIDRREILLGLVIPAEFARDLEAGRPASVQAIIDGSDANTAALVSSYAEAVVEQDAREVQIAYARRIGRLPPTPPLDLRPRVWYNPDMQSRNAIVPGLTAVIMMVIAAMLTSLTVAREWEQGTMEQLVATPVKGPELILGKLVPYFALGMLDVFIAVVMGEFLFKVPLRGSAALVFAMAAVFLAGALTLGMLISTMARNQLLASQLAMITTFLPAFLLSGFAFAIANMPGPIQWATRLVPARYFVVILKGIYMKGVGLEILGAEAALLAGFAVAVLALAFLRFKKRLG
jgi:ABC-2 type transport system permease protein